MKLGCSSSAYDAAVRSGQLDLLQFVRLCAEDLGVDGVEFVDAHFASVDPLYLRELKRCCTESGLTIASLAVTGDLGDASRRREETGHVQHWCDVAAFLGAPVVRLHAGRTAERADGLEAGRIAGLFKRVFGMGSPDRRRVWSDIAWALRDCADGAGERGIVLALQNDDAPGAVVDSAPLLWQLTRDVGSPWLRSCPDPGRLSDPAGLDLPMAKAVLATATLRDVRDDGSDSATHWPEVLRMLQLSKFRGFVMVDYAGPADPFDAVAHGIRHLGGAMHLLSRQRLLEEQAVATSNGRPTREAHGAMDETAIIEEAATVVARALRR